jgi:NAD(P)-dependent dehydrogenase (short-subunit alcohol dehydrogenase family)
VVVNDVGGAIDGAVAAEDPAQAVVEEIIALGGVALANHESVATPEGGAAMVAAAHDEFGRLDIVVNNAGILRDKSFGKLTPELVDPVIDVHLRGAFHVLVPAWGHMKEQGYGRIVNTSSGSGLFGNFGQANYGAAKAGLVGLTRVLAVEGRPLGIRANVVAPAASTRMTEHLLGERAALLSPDSIAPVVAFLAHRSCELSGQILSVGGGHVSAVLLTVTPWDHRCQLDRRDRVRPSRRAVRRRRCICPAPPRRRDQADHRCTRWDVNMISLDFTPVQQSFHIGPGPVRWPIIASSR